MTPDEGIGRKSRLRRCAAALQGAADLAALGGGWLAAFCIATLTFLVLTDTALAALSKPFPALPSSTGIGWEYSAYLMGAAFLLGSGMTLRAGLQLRVEIILANVGPMAARGMEIFAALLGSAVTCALTLWLLRFTLRNYGYGQVSQDSSTPLWIPQAVLTFGMALLALQMLARLVSALAGEPLDKPELGAATAIE